MKREKIIVAYDGVTPVYATPALLLWREKMRRFGEAWEDCLGEDGRILDAETLQTAKAEYFRAMVEGK